MTHVSDGTRPRQCVFNGKLNDADGETRGAIWIRDDWHDTWFARFIGRAAWASFRCVRSHDKFCERHSLSLFCNHGDARCPPVQTVRSPINDVAQFSAGFDQAYQGGGALRRGRANLPGPLLPIPGSRDNGTRVRYRARSGHSAFAPEADVNAGRPDTRRELLSPALPTRSRLDTDARFG